MPRAPRKGRARPGRAGEIRVRMYRQGLGDCLLVTLSQPGRAAFHIMIDCGVILGTPDARSRLAVVIDDIVRTTGGRVDVLAVTHEHYDHVAGFVLCADKFAPAGQRQEGRLSVGELWLAWTEKPGDPLAEQLREQRRKRKEALAGLVARLDGMGAAGGGLGRHGAAEAVQALRYFGVGATAAEAGSTETLGATARAMANAMKLAETVVFWEPGQTWQSDAAPGLKGYFLGPPRDAKALRRTDSTTEVYHLDAGFLEDAVSMAAGLSRDPDAAQRHAPFDKGHRRPLSAIVEGRDTGPTAAFVGERYLGRGAAAAKDDVAWRRIDDAWLGAAEQLALALDSATNNTSLALAIELAGSGKVLLFPADAQVGNWLSWHAVPWGDAEPGVTTGDLLARTVFYKVAHHGSHNATLKMRGLEMMPKTGMVAFVPVDKEMAETKRWFEMPLESLMAALRERCGDAVARTDEDLVSSHPGLSSGGTGGPFGSLYHEWVQRL